MKTIGKNELVTLFQGVSGNTFVGLTYIAPVNMRKTGNPYVGHDVVKVSVLSGQFGADYEKKVEKATGEEFTAGPRQWGENAGKGLIYKDGQPHSIQLTIDNKPSEVEYRIDGVKVEKTVLEPFLPSKREGEPVTVRDFRLDRIAVLRVYGEEYLVVA